MKTSQAPLVLLALAAACSLQGGLTDLGENEPRGDGGESGSSVTGNSDSKTLVPGAGGKVGQASSGSASIPVGGTTQGGAGNTAESGAPGEPEPNGEAGAAPQPVLGFASKQNEYGFALEDSFFITGCATVQEHDCLYPFPGVCPQDSPDYAQRGDRFEESFEMGGTRGKTYLVTIAVSGIVEGKFYMGGARRATQVFEPDKVEGQDMLYVGGEAPLSTYRAYKLSVLEPNGTTLVQSYFLNSVPDYSHENHRTYAIDYQVTLEVPGQGVVRFLNHDVNCHSINNCGVGDISGVGCPEPRRIPGEPDLPIPAEHGGRSVAEMNAVNGAQQPYHAQIIHVRVLSVTLK